MNISNPIDLLFGGMEKLGPGGNAQTLHVLRLLPKQRFHVIVDAGCGAGRQTMVLAKELGTLVHAVDAYEPFLHDLVRRAQDLHMGVAEVPFCTLRWYPDLVSFTHQLAKNETLILETSK
jgi:trans-aconitate methyltransferase